VRARALTCARERTHAYTHTRTSASRVHCAPRQGSPRWPISVEARGRRHRKSTKKRARSSPLSVSWRSRQLMATGRKSFYVFILAEPERSAPSARSSSPSWKPPTSPICLLPAFDPLFPSFLFFWGRGGGEGESHWKNEDCDYSVLDSIL